MSTLVTSLREVAGSETAVSLESPPIRRERPTLLQVSGPALILWSFLVLLATVAIAYNVVAIASWGFWDIGQRLFGEPFLAPGATTQGQP